MDVCINNMHRKAEYLLQLGHFSHQIVQAYLDVLNSNYMTQVYDVYHFLNSYIVT